MSAHIPPGRIDVHTHAIDPHLPDLSGRYPSDQWPLVDRRSETDAVLVFGGAPYRRIDNRCWASAARVSDMDRFGVALQVLSPIPVTFCYQASVAGAAELATAQNDFFAKLVSEYPNRFAALGAVPLQDPDLAVEEMRRCMRQPGFLGVEIGTQVRGRELSDETFDRFFAIAAELGALVLVHPSDQDLLTRTTEAAIGFGAGMPLETGLTAALLITSGALRRRPSVRICLAHGGGTLPAMIGRLDKGSLLAGVPSDSPELPSKQASALWADSLTYRLDALRAAIGVFGADHVVLGSDYPFPAMPDPIADVVAELPGELRNRISRTNAEEIYGEILGAGDHALPDARRH